MRTKWNCSSCQMSSDRLYNVRRHIQRRHGGMGEPVSYNSRQCYKDTNPENFHFPFAYSHHVPSSSLIRKENSDKNFSDFLEHQILQPLRKIVEVKNLISQLSTIQPQQQRIMSGDGVYPTIASTTFDTSESNNNLSEYSRSEDYVNDYSEIVGYRGHVCEKCTIINIDTIFRHNDGESGQIETTHTCSSKRLADAQLKLDKDRIIITDLYKKLPEVMKKKVNSWTKNSAYLVAMEMPPTAALNNCFEINPTDDSHWAVRAIKDKQTILNDEELSDFLCKVRDSTYAAFKVIAPSSQQQQQQESSTRCYLMIITDNKIELSVELLLQYIADLSDRFQIIR
jgi:hypothetical protein